MELTLADLETVQALLAIPTAAEVKARDRAASSGAGPRRQLVRCTCGSCRICRDNARWERIFQEKFADPHYYSHPPARHASPLVELLR